MSTRRRADHALAIVFNVLLLPARIFEEGIHAVAALPWAEEVIVRLDPRGDVAQTEVQYREGTPRWAIVLAHVAPELLAAIAALVTIAYWSLGGTVWWPASTLDWLLLWLVGTQFLAIAAPERGAVGGGGSA